MFTSYLEQLERAAEDAQVELSDACKAEGIADTTLARWRKDEAAPRDATARALFKRIGLMAKSPPEERRKAS